MTREEVFQICKAMSDANRLRVIEMLTTGEKCGCDLLEELQVTQPTLSHHMKILCDADIVQGRKDGKWVHYSLNPAGAERAKKLLEEQVALEFSGEQDEKCCDK